MLCSALLNMKRQYYPPQSASIWLLKIPILWTCLNFYCLKNIYMNSYPKENSFRWLRLILSYCRVQKNSHFTWMQLDRRIPFHIQDSRLFHFYFTSKFYCILFLRLRKIKQRWGPNFWKQRKWGPAGGKRGNHKSDRLRKARTMHG